MSGLGALPSILDFHGIDPGGERDCSTGIKAAHDAVAAAGYRHLEFPPGLYLAPHLQAVGNVIFVGPGVLLGAHRKHVIAHGTGPGVAAGHDLVPARHHRRFLQAVAAATPDSPACYMVAGDSLAEGGSPIAASERLAALLRRRLVETFGPAADTIALENYGLGGTTWSDWAAPSPPPGLVCHPWRTDPAAPLLQAVIARNPDAVLWSLGQNDTGFFDLRAMRHVLAEVAARCPKRFGLPPDIILMTPYAPSVMAPETASRDEQEPRDYVAGYIRSYAQCHGHGLIDENRVAAMARDGFDVRSQRMRLVYGEATVRLPYDFPQGAHDFAVSVLFAEGERDLWNHGPLVIPLSARAGNALILERDPATFQAVVTIDAATDVPCRPRTPTGLGTPGGPLLLECVVKGAQVQVALNGFPAIDMAAERHGALFLPGLGFAGGATPEVRLLQAVVGVPMPCMPDLLDCEQFGTAGGEAAQNGVLWPYGGNGVNHQSSLGMQRVTARALEATRFA